MLILVLAGWCVGHIDNDIFSHPLVGLSFTEWGDITSTAQRKTIERLLFQHKYTNKYLYWS